jgi:hypothetical protein
MPVTVVIVVVVVVVIVIVIVIIAIIIIIIVTYFESVSGETLASPSADPGSILGDFK